jgi:hypothetical protein
VDTRRLLLLLVSSLALAGCSGWIEEQRRLARRQSAEAELIAAVDSGDAARARALLDKDRSLANSIRMVSGRSGSRRAETALTLATKQGRRDVAEVLLEKGADPRLPDGNGDLPLGAALNAEKDSLALVGLLLDSGADPAQSDGNGRTALHQAAGSRSEEAAQTLPLLLAKASGAGGPDARGRTPLHYAASSASLAAIRLLVARGADTNARSAAPQVGAAMPDDVAGATPLALVARDRQIAAAATLCALGADPDLADATGASARDVAARVARAEAARPKPIDVDLARHRNMAAFLARGGGCDALASRHRSAEAIADAEVERIANESECEAGWGWACGQAGWAFHRGEGAPRDAARAYALFRKGCETALTRNTWSCGMVGIFHVEGTSVRKDPVEGARWLKLGCEPSDPRRADEQACTRLGLLHAEGTGVPKDLVRARALFKTACNAKYEKACANLAKYGGS